jgi:glutathione-specific gamma-glutamylcyclotransferase
MRGEDARAGAVRGQARIMVLRRELIAAAFPESVPDDRAAMPLLPDAAISTSLDRTLARLGNGRDLWLFAYGSLMWRPELDFAESRLATLRGWHRRFCLWQWRYRGSRERPGLMLALDRGGSCRGVAYRVAAPGLRGKVADVWRREMIALGYRPRWVRVETEPAPVEAIAFVANREGGRYAGRLDEAAIAERVAAACGHIGPCAEYLLETAARCEELGIHDRHLWRLQALVAAHLARPAPAAA